MAQAKFPRPFGRYTLLRPLATGGMAEVYLARSDGPEGFEKECVIKRILPALAVDNQFVKMFLDEARIAARLSHPNIVQIYDLGRVGDHEFFLAMEHVRGVDLSHVLEAVTARQSRIPLPIALRLISNVAEGLDHAHHATDTHGQPLGIVHRDVTPSNIIISVDGVAKVLDFGIAKVATRQNTTEVGVIKGKIAYMSPEQVQGEKLDARSDVFSLGTILYEITTGQKPFEGQGMTDVSLKILHDEPTPPEILVDDYPEALGALVRQAQAKRVSDRLVSARALQVAIDEFLVQSGVRCTSHEVAAYLNDLFPSLRQEFSQPLPVGMSPGDVVNGPTVPMRREATPQARGGDDTDRDLVSQSLVGDTSQPMDSFEDRHRSLQGSSWGTRFAVLLVIGGVAFAFWWLRNNMRPGESPGEAHKAVQEGKAAHPEPTLEVPKPEALKGEAPTVEEPAVVEPAKPEVAVPLPAPPKKASAPPAHKHKASRPHRPSTPAVQGPPLPRLPAPPPVDDAP